MKAMLVTAFLMVLSVSGSAAIHKESALKRASREAAAKSRIARPELVGDSIQLVDDPHSNEYGRPGATFVAVHFSKVVLGPSDSLTVETPDHTTRSVKYGHVHAPFWSVSIPGSRALIRLDNQSHTASFAVDQYALGLPADSVVSLNQPSFAPQEICGFDDSKEARCYAPGIQYTRAKAVARLLINGRYACTGWLVGPEGHLLTNEHCVHDSSDSVQVEFMAEGTDCNTDCNVPFACPGQIVAAPEQHPVTFITASRKNDYALLKLDSSAATQFGYLQLRKAGPVKNEPIYIPQYPRGVGKRLLVVSSEPDDQPSGLAHLNSTAADACDGGTQKEAGYQADTDPGASGSPIISAVDDLVIALHHCGGCPNHGIPINRIITSLGKKLPATAVK